MHVHVQLSAALLGDSLRATAEQVCVAARHTLQLWRASGAREALALRVMVRADELEESATLRQLAPLWRRCELELVEANDLSIAGTFTLFCGEALQELQFMFCG